MCSFDGMKEHLVVLVTMAGMLVAMSGTAQEQLDGPGFESWTNTGSATQEPSEWSSLKTSDGGAFLNALVPQLCWRSSDAHSGSYSVELRTVNSAIGPANGLLTNGRVHAELDVANSYMFTDQGNEQWRTSHTSRPDSLVGWYKASPEAGDRANVGALLHVDEGRLPAFGTQANYVAGATWKAPYASVGTWTRFSTPFQYQDDRTPEWILLILTSGDSAGSVVGSRAWFDDLALIYNINCSPSVPEVEVEPDQATDLVVGYVTGGAPTAPLLFRVELSDAQGSFAQPLILGSLLSSTAEGVIPCTVPASTLPGPGYRVRVTTASPYYAPVPVSLPLVAATGVDELSVPVVPIIHENGRMLIDLRAVDLRDVEMEIFDLDGRRVHSQQLTAGTLNTVERRDLPRFQLLRFTHRQGAWTVRSVRD
jgi:hypothetical protein